jgi:methionyl-tRNA formyltransferase
MDTGPVLHQTPWPFAPEETAGTLTEKLAALGPTRWSRHWRSCGSAGSPRCRRTSRAPPTRRRSTGRHPGGLDGRRRHVGRGIRAFDPQPGAWSTLGGSEIKLFGAPRRAAGGRPGEF